MTSTDAQAQHAGEEDPQRGALATAVASDPELAALCALFFRHTTPEVLAGVEPEQLLETVRAHLELAGRRTLSRPVVGLRDVTIGVGVKSTILEIVTDDMPFLVESVVAGVHRRNIGVRRMVHPIVVVRRTVTGDLEEFLPEADPDAPPAGTQVESWMHVELEPLADQAAADGLIDEVNRLLGDVRDVVEDTERMTHAARELAATLRKNPPPLDPDQIADGARLLEWLTDGHFTFLGYRRYELDTPGEGAELTAMLASGLGVLRGDNLGTTSFAPGSNAVERATARELLLLSQASTPSRVSRPVYPSYLSVKIFDADGNVTGEHRFLGMLTVRAHYAPVLEIPMVERRVHAALHRAGFPLDSYSGQRMLEIISSYPRDQLFWASSDELYELALGVLSIAERRQLRLFLHRDPYRRFVSALVYLPRDRYTTSSRLAVQEVLRRELGGSAVEYTARVNESSVAMLQVTVHTDPDTALEVDTDRVQEQLSEAVRTWEDQVLARCAGSTALTESVRRYLPFVPAAYQEDFDATTAIQDLARLEGLGDKADMTLYTPVDAGEGDRRFKLFLAGAEVPLTTMLPVLQAMGVEVIEERPYRFGRPDGQRCWIYDFGLRLDEPTQATIRAQGGESVRDAFCGAFAAAWRGDAEVDRFNALVLRAGLSWRQAALLRALARYQRQIGTPYSQGYLADILIGNAPIAVALVRLFEARFDPAHGSADNPDRVNLTERRLGEVSAMIDEVTGLDADRVLRGYLNLITSTIRTNFFANRPYLAFKLNPGSIRELPPPAPRFEIFVYSPRVEGVHLRFGPVARGGLRWSDRPADFRTEILGLVKAQAVKNAVIVPVGAKGGFVVKNPPAPTGDPAADREASQAEGIACYRLFISALLDLTDNLVGGQVQPPDGVVRHDADDSYLVVAADKGTATFSDIANALAVERGFWLGDAFASGGSAGYDHKAMGITAKGAWESVKRSFRELGVDTQSQEFTVVGVGDMSGDVFGNGMLLSEHIRLIAAFDHRHVFVDPTPDAARSFAERSRLFALPRSSWADYDASLISDGGGVWSRTTKAIPVSEPMRVALGLEASVQTLTPPQLIRSILLAPVDLLWNGGVGTYVKASTESNSDVGDKANDPVRVDATQLRVRVVGEGGNLGLTQRGRIQFARAGGRVNTDALDNSAGVDCSDHEVNIKIALAGEVGSGRLSESQRNRLLVEMTDDVSRLVLSDNFSQNAVLGVSRAHAHGMTAVHGRLVADLEARTGLDRALDVLPDNGEFAALDRGGQGLSSPELATVLAHVKLDLKARLLATDLPEAQVFADRVRNYFPAALRDRFPAAISAHPLRREIIATQLINEVVDGGGLSYAYRLSEELAAEAGDAIRAYAIATTVFELPALWEELERLDTGQGAGMDVTLADSLVLETRRLLDRAARWFLTNRPQPLAVGAEISRFRPTVSALRDRIPGWIVGSEREAQHVRIEALVNRGASADLARTVGTLLDVFCLLDIVEITELSERSEVERDPAEVAELYHAMSDYLGVDAALTSVTELERGNRWHALARLALRDDLYASLRGITLDTLRESSPGESIGEMISSWERISASKLNRARAALDSVRQTGKLDLATLSVMSRELRGLVR